MERSSLIQFARTLITTIGAKDYSTKRHSIRVAHYSKEIAKRYGLSEEEQERIFMMGLLHDIGKIGVPDYILNKPGRLTDEENEIFKRHTLLGERILQNNMGFFEPAVVARWHHERFDGKGYPDGIAGEKIPVGVRIVAIAEAFDEINQSSIFGDSPSKAEVRNEIENGSGSQFDPSIAKILLEMMDEGYNFDIKDPEYYEELIYADNFFESIIIILTQFKFRFPNFYYSETDLCYYSASPDRQLDGNPYFLRITLKPLEDGTEDDYEATIDAGLYDDIYMKTGWKFSFNLGTIYYKDGVWTN